jgi:SAM-dependent methyltransferase
MTHGEAIDACRICGVAEGEPVATVQATHTSTWIACAGCGVQRIDPYPSPEELAAYYDDHYRDNDDFAAAGFSVSHRMRYSPDYSDRLHGEYAQSLADMGITVGRGTRALDYGCADGGFLEFLAERGLDPQQFHGLDVSREMVDVVIAKGFRGVTLVERGQLAGEQFDLITLWDVIEHLSDPLDTLRWLRPLLAREGRLLIQTPRIGLLSDALGDRFEHYLPFEHVHLFTRESLCDMGERAGYAVERCGSFGANAPPESIPMPYKLAWDRLAKATDHGATQLVVLKRSAACGPEAKR